MIQLSNQQIDPTVHWILDRATCEGDKVYLNYPQLDRSTYEQVDTVLKRLGGKWRGGRVKAHIFPYDPQPLMQAVLDSQMMPADNPLAFYPTPRFVVEQLVTEAEMEHLRLFDGRYSILEPSAGSGSIADVLMEQYGSWVDLDMVEINPLNVQALQSKGYDPVEADFLQFQTEKRYDRVIMNPPFATPGEKKAYQQHIYHAFSMLNPGGILVSVAPMGVSFRSDDRGFDAWVTRHGHRTELPRHAFKESGTDIASCVITVRNEDQSWRKGTFNGHPSWDIWCLTLYENNDIEDHEAHERVANRIRGGELGLDLLGYPLPETEQAIRKHYQWLIDKYRREYGECVMLEEWEWTHVIQRFVDRLKDD